MPWHGCEPPSRLQCFDAPQDGHEPTMGQPGDNLACPRAMLPQACEHASCDLCHAVLPRGEPPSGRNGTITGSAPIRKGAVARRPPAAPREGGVPGREPATAGGVAPAPVGRLLSPTPYGPWADGSRCTSPATGPRSQTASRRPRHIPGTAVPAVPLMRRHPQRLIQRRHLRDDPAPGTAATRCRLGSVHTGW